MNGKRSWNMGDGLAACLPPVNLCIDSESPFSPLFQKIPPPPPPLPNRSSTFTQREELEVVLAAALFFFLIYSEKSAWDHGTF